MTPLPFRLALVLLLFGTLTPAFAQHNGRVRPRPDDHFIRQRVVMRLDLQEKANRPLVDGLTLVHSGPEDLAEYPYRHGMVQALMTAYENGTLMGYHPDSLNLPQTFDRTYAGLLESAGNLPGQRGPAQSGMEQALDGPSGLPDSPVFDDPFSDGEFGGEFDEGFSEGFNFADGFEFGTEPWDANDGPAGGNGLSLTHQQAADQKQAAYAGLNSVLELVADRIFDQNRSDLVYDDRYLRLVWQDPLGQLPDENVVVFRLEDARQVLAQTAATNYANEAETRSVAELLAQRKFNGFYVNVSGREMLSLQEAQLRRAHHTAQEAEQWSH